MNAAERMTVLCADGRKRAGERGDSESWEVWEDLEDLFGQVAEALENEPETTVRPFVSGMARALTATAAHASRWHHAPAVMADWLAERDRTGETPGETCAYGDLMRFYGYLDALYGSGNYMLNIRTVRALSVAAGELSRLIERNEWEKTA